MALTPKRRVVLLVEDNPGDAELIAELLLVSTQDDDVVLALTLSDAVSRLRGLAVDVVLLDLRLPDGSGVECVHAIRGRTVDAPIVVLTGLDDETLALACIAAGAQDYLSKHELRAEGLRRAIGYAIARQHETSERRRADALQERLAAIVESSSDAIISTTPDGVITSWNSGAERIFGHTRDEAIGRSAIQVMRAADDTAAAVQQQRLARLREDAEGLGVDDLVRLRKDGSPVTLSVVSCNLRDAAGDVIGLAAICRDVTESRRRDDELRRRNDELLARDGEMRALMARLNEIREEERTRISRAVHDELGQLLTGLKMDLRWISRRLAPDAPSAIAAISAKLTEAEKLIDSTIETVQRIAVELRPSVLDVLGLPAAIRDEARRFERRTGIATEVLVDDSSRPTPEVATALFRIYQELLTNIARHAHATVVRIHLDQIDENWVLRVADDGVGLRSAETRRLPSLGLLGIRERASSLGGVFRLEGGGGGGTIAIVQIPLNRAEAPCETS